MRCEGACDCAWPAAVDVRRTALTEIIEWDAKFFFNKFNSLFKRIERHALMTEVFVAHIDKFFQKIVAADVISALIGQARYIQFKTGIFAVDRIVPEETQSPAVMDQAFL